MQRKLAMNLPFFSSEDLFLFQNGQHRRLGEVLGAHTETTDSKEVDFAVWIPGAKQVSVVGNWNQWQPESHPLSLSSDNSGVWFGRFSNIPIGASYRYHIGLEDQFFEKCDPCAGQWQKLPAASTLIWSLQYRWCDDDWMRQRRERNALSDPWAIYQVHLPSWKRMPEQNYRVLDYEQLGQELAEYAQYMGYTHIELLPVMEDAPYDITGFESLGFFAPAARHGTPQQFMHLIDNIHHANVGVVLNIDLISFDRYHYGLSKFNGENLYESSQLQLDTPIFDFTRGEVRSFLRSAVFFWVEKFHIDAIKLTGLDKLFNCNNELLISQALEFFNDVIADMQAQHPDVAMLYDAPANCDKWVKNQNFDLISDVSWGKKLISYGSIDPILRKDHHQELIASTNTKPNKVIGFSYQYALDSEGSVLSRLAGDDWRKRATLRLLLAYLYAIPGKKMLFMGIDFGQWQQWNLNESIDWHLLNLTPHHQLLEWTRDLNHFYRSEKALNGAINEDTTNTLEWIDNNDSEQSIVSFVRMQSTDEYIVAIFNFTPVPRHNYMIGVPSGGWWQELLNSDAAIYGGAGYGNLGGVEASPISIHGKRYSLNLSLPPLAVLFLKKPIVN